jgi:hypothetical protein
MGRKLLDRGETWEMRATHAQGHAASVNGVVLSPDSKCLATGLGLGHKLVS